jgi:hypothetical protein
MACRIRVRLRGSKCAGGPDTPPTTNPHPLVAPWAVAPYADGRHAVAAGAIGHEKSPRLGRVATALPGLVVKIGSVRC